jgi:hypothetical protein
MDELQLLRDRIDELEQILGVDLSLTSRLRGALGITRDQARMLGLLLNRNMVTHDAMFTVLYGDRPDCDQPQPKVMDVQLCKLRKVTSLHGIDIKTLVGEGWQMPMAEKAKVRALLVPVDQADSTIDDLPRFLPQRAA